MGKALNPAQVAQIFRLREEKDDWGDPKWSGAYIAEQLGVSESTVWRVLTKRAAYTVKKGGRIAAEEARWNALQHDSFEMEKQEITPELKAAAMESQERFLAMLARERELAAVTPEMAEKLKRYGAGGE